MTNDKEEPVLFNVRRVLIICVIGALIFAAGLIIHILLFNTQGVYGFQQQQIAYGQEDNEEEKGLVDKDKLFIIQELTKIYRLLNKIHSELQTLNSHLQQLTVSPVYAQLEVGNSTVGDRIALPPSELKKECEERGGGIWDSFENMCWPKGSTGGGELTEDELRKKLVGGICEPGFIYVRNMCEDTDRFWDYDENSQVCIDAIAKGFACTYTGEVIENCDGTPKDICSILFLCKGI